MATIFKATERQYRENPGRIEPFRLFSDENITSKMGRTGTLNFDMRRLDPGEYSSTYHFHRYGEELFMIISGQGTLRTPDGLEKVYPGDILFFEAGPTGAHQLYNHSGEPCQYLDVRMFPGYDVCEYPDSGKLLLVPSMEIYARDSLLGYFDGEENVEAIWEELRRDGDK